MNYLKVITLTESMMGLQGEGGGVGEGFLGRESHGRELSKPFIMEITLMMIVMLIMVMGSEKNLYRLKSYLVINAKEVKIVKEVKRSDGL